MFKFCTIQTFQNFKRYFDYTLLTQLINDRFIYRGLKLSFQLLLKRSLTKKFSTVLIYSKSVVLNQGGGHASPGGRR